MLSYYFYQLYQSHHHHIFLIPILYIRDYISKNKMSTYQWFRYVKVIQNTRVQDMYEVVTTRVKSVWEKM